MKKATVIATCLVNSGFVRDLVEGEDRVRLVFANDFPTRDFRQWNGELNEKVAQAVIRNVGRASMINVRLFIEDLA